MDKWLSLQAKSYRQPIMLSAHPDTTTACVKNGARNHTKIKRGKTSICFLVAEYHDPKEQQKVNNSQNNFHGANTATNITVALEI
jgi:hypothetical protein